MTARNRPNLRSALFSWDFPGVKLSVIIPTYNELERLTLEKKLFVPNLLDNEEILRHIATLCRTLYSIGKDVIVMVCTTVKEGHDCFFMTKKGCQFNGGTCHIIVEQCEGCQKSKQFPTGTYCLVFPDPASKWRVGKCSMATHVATTAKAENGKLNPLKASKRKAH